MLLSSRNYRFHLSILGVLTSLSRLISPKFAKNFWGLGTPEAKAEIKREQETCDMLYGRKNR